MTIRKTYLCYECHSASKCNSSGGLSDGITLSLNTRALNMRAWYASRIPARVYKKKGRESAVTEMHNIITVRGTCRRLTEYKCTSGIFRFNHERMYTFVPLCRSWLRYVMLLTIFSGPPDQRRFTFLLAMFKNERGEMCIVTAMTAKCEHCVYKINIGN